MRGWIMGGHGTCAVQGLADDSLELGHGPLAVVVDDGVVELRRERELALGDVEPLVDLALALRRPQAEPPLAIPSTGERPSATMRSSSDQSVPERRPSPHGSSTHSRKSPSSSFRSNS